MRCFYSAGSCRTWTIRPGGNSCKLCFRRNPSRKTVAQSITTPNTIRDQLHLEDPALSPIYSESECEAETRRNHKVREPAADFGSLSRSDHVLREGRQVIMRFDP